MVSETRPLILFHDNCADGFCSAWIAWQHFKDRADYLPVQYGQPPPDVANRDIFILDFSYKRAVLLDMALSANHIVVLDHHKTAQEDLRGIEEESRYLGKELTPKKLFVHFDMEKSGARLTWERFHRDKKAPWLVDFTEDRDLWRWQLPNSRELNAALASLPRTFQEWEHISSYETAGVRLVVEGKAILRYQAQLIDSLVKNAREINIDGFPVLCVNTPILISEVAGRLAEGRSFGVCYFTASDGKVVWSLRSTPTGIDVSKIARQYGGGGHAHAAGWTQEKI